MSASSEGIPVGSGPCSGSIHRLEFHTAHMSRAVRACIQRRSKGTPADGELFALAAGRDFFWLPGFAPPEAALCDFLRAR